jgi:hypothetical protein
MTDSRSYRKRLSLPFELWPEADRNAWTAACQPAARLKRGGRLAISAQLRVKSTSGITATFLDFLIGMGCSDETHRLRPM